VELTTAVALLTSAERAEPAFGVSEVGMDESGSHVEVVFTKRRVQLVRELARQSQKAKNVP
jgi:hypothetical protein